MNPQYPAGQPSPKPKQPGTQRRRQSLSTPPGAVAPADPLPTSPYGDRPKNFHTGNFPKQVADHKKSVTISTLEL